MPKRIEIFIFVKLGNILKIKLALDQKKRIISLLSHRPAAIHLSFYLMEEQNIHFKAHIENCSAITNCFKANYRIFCSLRSLVGRCSIDPRKQENCV